MKRIKLFFLLLVCFSVCGRSYAQITDISQYENILYCPTHESMAGEQKIELSLEMNNLVNINGFQCDVYLPDGFSFSEDENSIPLVFPSGRTLEHGMNLFSSSIRKDGSLRIVCGSSNGSAFPAGHGEVALITINAPSTITPGTYYITTDNIHFSDAASHDYSIFGSVVSALQFKKNPQPDDSPIIVFTDPNVKEICVANWDLNSDGELSEKEAAAVSTIGTVFRKKENILYFDEFRYFTGVTELEKYAFEGSGLITLSLPPSAWYCNFGAFLNMPNLREIYSFSDRTLYFQRWDDWALGKKEWIQDFSQVNLYVPFGKIDSYTEEMTWPVFAKIDHIFCQIWCYLDGKLYQIMRLAYEEPIPVGNYPSQEGYSFSGWSGMPLIMPFHDVEVTGTFIVNQYTITFDTDGGSDVAPITQDYKSAVAAPVPPTKTGYTFAGWNKAIPATMPAENVTIKALWTINQYTITFDTDGGSDVAPITQDYNSAVTAPENPTKTGYTFAGWDKEIPSVMPAENITIKALWTVNQYTITFDADGGSYVAPITQKYGAVIAIPASPTKGGYSFVGWDKAIPSVMPAENITIKALWTINQYTITFDTDGGSEIEPVTQDYNSAVSAPADPVKTGYTFAGWDREIPATIPAENITIKALWTINQYKVTFIAEGIVISEETLDYGSHIIVPEAPEKEGYSFVNWGEVDETVPANDVVFIANYEVNYYTLTYILDDEVYAEFDVAFGETIIPLEVDPVEGCLFEGWQDVPVIMPSHDVKVYGTTVLTNISVMATEGSHLDVYTLGGILVKKNVDVTTLRSTLKPGIYIINGKKVKL